MVNKLFPTSSLQLIYTISKTTVDHSKLTAFRQYYSCAIGGQFATSKNSGQRILFSQFVAQSILYLLVCLVFGLLWGNGFVTFYKNTVSKSFNSEFLFPSNRYALVVTSDMKSAYLPFIWCRSLPWVFWTKRTVSVLLDQAIVPFFRAWVYPVPYINGTVASQL